MARGVQVSKMGKRKRSSSWSVVPSKRAKTIVPRRRNSRYTIPGRITGLGRGNFGFPDKLRTTLKYGESVQQLLVAGTITNYVFRMNSLNDPNFSGVGHQPKYYDQFCSANGPYLSYRVLGSKIKVTFTPVTDNTPGVANNCPVLCGIQCSPLSTISATTDGDLMEASNTYTALCMSKPGGNNTAQVVNTFSLSRDLAADVGDDTTGAAYNGNPTDGYFANILMLDTNFTPVMKIYIEQEFSVEFYDLYDSSRS